jgi:broad specificity phosphatase PhoE
MSRSLSRRELSDVEALSSNFEQCRGGWSAGENRLWEPLSSVRRRALDALRRQATGHSEAFIAVCHATGIRALTGHFHADFCGVRVARRPGLTGRTSHSFTPRETVFVPAAFS